MRNKDLLTRFCAASLAIVLPSLAARAQCQGTNNLEQFPNTPSNGSIKTMAEWDPDGPGGVYSNLMVMGGTFTTMGNLTGLPGLVGWDGSHYVPVPVDPTPWAPTTALLYNWQTGNGPWLVQVSDGPDPTLAINTGSNWSNITQFTGGTVTALTSWAPLGPSGSNWLIVAGSNLRVGTSVGPANVLRFDGSSWQTVTNISGSSALVNTVGSWTISGSSTGLMVGGSFDHLSLTPAMGGASVAANNVGYVTYSSAGGGTYTLHNMGGSFLDPNTRVNALQPWQGGMAVGTSAQGTYIYTNPSNGAGTFSPITGPTLVHAMTLWDPDGIGPLPTELVINGSSSSGFGLYSNGFQIGGANFASLGYNSLIPIGVWDPIGSGGTQPQWLFWGPYRINTGTQWIPTPNIGVDVLYNAPGGPGALFTVASVSNLTTTNPNGTFFGGDFDYAGLNPFLVNNVAVFSNGGWGPVGSGLNSRVTTFGTIHSNFGPGSTSLYAGGLFTASGATSVNHIARLSGGPLTTYTWNALGSGLNGPPYAMIQFDPDGAGSLPTCLVAGGSFTTAGGASANNIAFWNPTASTWSTFGSGFNGQINALVVWDPDGTGPLAARLVAGGQFTTASGIAISNLAWWDGIQWQPFEGGTPNGPVNSLFVWADPANPTQPRLVIGGSFTQAGGTPANNVAVWRPSGWITAMGSGVTGSGAVINAITTSDLDGPNSPAATSGAELFIGGSFDHNGQGDTLSNLAHWDIVSQRWVAAGQWASTLSGPPIRFVRSWTSNSDGRPTLLVGGNFNQPSGRDLAVWWSTQPYITAVPAPTTAACTRSTVALTISVLGDNLVYRWQRNGVNLNNAPTGTGSTTSGVDTPTLTITNAGSADNGSYTCNIFSSCGNTTTPATTLTVAPCCGSADFNCDGDLGTDSDISAFFACLAGNCPPPPCTSNADFNHDGDTGTDSDIEAFFRVLSGGSC